MSEGLVLVGARVVDSRGVVTEHADVRAEGGTITAVGAVEPHPNDRIVDVTGRTVCPGLMNAHVHVCLDAGTDPERAFHAETDVETALRSLPRLAQTLARGVTTVRDLGGKHEVTLALARLAAEGIISAPRILAAGRVVTMSGGHGHWMGIEIDGPDEARRATRRMLAAGAAVIKVMATAGMMTSGQRAGAAQLTTEEMAACVEEAHKAGIPVAAHVEGRDGASNALQAGVDSIEHGHGLDDELLQVMAARGTTLVPTIACDRAIVGRGTEAGIPQFIVDDCARLAPSLEVALRRAIEIGVPIAAGNDGGAPLTHPGDIVDELEIYVELGMSPLAALASATINTARLFGLATTGLVTAGHDADLIVVDGDPLTSVAVLRRPELVVTHGRVVVPAGRTPR
ncbi:MAG: amidohydrolase family protein [Acidimicrobiia bacterium]